MNDWLKVNQEEKIIKNCVESIMEDLDDYYFDELIMKQYQKRLIEFFKKISKEYSLFKAEFDFSNKKNIVNDKEKIEEVLRLIKKLLIHKRYKTGFIIPKIMLKDLEEIKNILEK